MLKIFRNFYLTFSFSILLLPTCFAAMDAAHAKPEPSSLWNRFKSGVSSVAEWTTDKVFGVADDDDVPLNWWEEPAPRDTRFASTKILNSAYNGYRMLMAHDGEANDVTCEIEDEILRSMPLSKEDQRDYDAWKSAKLSEVEPEERLKKWENWHNFVNSGPMQPTEADWIIWAAQTLPKLPQYYRNATFAWRLVNGEYLLQILSSVNTSGMPEVNIPVFSYNPAAISINRLSPALAKAVWVYRLFIGHLSFLGYIEGVVRIGGGYIHDIPAVREWETKQVLNLGFYILKKLGWASAEDIKFIQESPDVVLLFTQYPQLKHVTQAYIDRYVFRKQISPEAMKCLLSTNQFNFIDPAKVAEPGRWLCDAGNYPWSVHEYLANKNAASQPQPQDQANPVVAQPATDPAQVVPFGDIVKVFKRMIAVGQDKNLNVDQQTAAFSAELKNLNELVGATARVDDSIANAASNTKVLSTTAINTGITAVVGAVSSPVEVFDKVIEIPLEVSGKVGDAAVVATNKGMELVGKAGEFIKSAETKQSWQAFWRGLTNNVEVETTPAVQPGEQPAKVGPKSAVPTPGKKTILCFTFCKIANRNPEAVKPLLDKFYERWCKVPEINQARSAAASPTLKRELFDLTKSELKDGAYDLLRDGLNAWLHGEQDFVKVVQESIEESFFDALMDLDNIKAPVCKKYDGQASSAAVPAPENANQGPGRIKSACNKTKAYVESTIKFLAKLDVKPEEAAILGQSLRSFILNRGLAGGEEDLDKWLAQDAPAYAQVCEVIADMEAEKTPEEKAEDEKLAASLLKFDKKEESATSVSSVLGDLNKPLFEIPVFDHLSLVLYKKDIAQFSIRILDHYVDKMFFNQINDHYHKKICSGFELKKKKLIAILDTCSRDGELDVTKADTMEARMAQQVFINHCAGVLNAGRTGINLKWIMQICLHLFLKHMVYKAECVVNPFNPLAKMANLAKEKSLKVPDAFKGLTMTNAFNWMCDYGVASGNAEEQKRMTEQLKDGSLAKGKQLMTDIYKNYKYNASIYPLIEIFCFGNTHLLDFKAERVYMASMWAIWIAITFMNLRFNTPPDWLTGWFQSLPYVGSAFKTVPASMQKVPFFGRFVQPISETTLIDWASSDSVCFVIRVALMSLFLKRLNNMYQSALKNYIKDNVYLFVKTVSDMKQAGELGKEDLSFHEIMFKDFLKKAHSTCFEEWRRNKQFNQTGFFGMGAALAMFGAGAGVINFAVS